MKTTRILKKRHFIVMAMCLFTFTANAQLKVNSDGHVGMGSNVVLYPQLSVNSSLLSQDTDYSIGIATATDVENGKTNVGLESIIDEGTYKTPFSNQGIRGMVKTSNASQGRNYGVTGIIAGGTGYYGGAGIYGATSFLQYLEGTNISGTYAGYFNGAVNVTGQLTAPNIVTYVPYPYRNISLIGEEDSDNHQILENLLNINVIEFDQVSNNENVLSERITEILHEHPEYRELVEEREPESRHHFGIQVEDLKAVYPSLVEEGQDGGIGINYIELVPILIRSIQELKQELDEIKGVAKNEQKAPLVSDVKQVLSTSKNKLYQNAPNPFKEKAVIRFQLANDVSDAIICIFDMSGKMLKRMPISAGMDSVYVNGYELGEGMFLYSLLVNGQEIDTKKMILTK